jgi:hypothetical protein
MELASRPPVSPMTRVGIAFPSCRSSFSLWTHCLSTENINKLECVPDTIRPFCLVELQADHCESTDRARIGGRRTNRPEPQYADCSRAFTPRFSGQQQVEDRLPQSLALRVNDRKPPLVDARKRLDDRALAHLQVKSPRHATTVKRARVGDQRGVDGRGLRRARVQKGFRLLKRVQDLASS